MTEGDIVVVPRPYGFTVCRLVDQIIVSPLRSERDIGFEWNVEILANNCTPRESFASTGLLSRMKCRQTTLQINDLANDVDKAISSFKNNTPFSLPVELAKKCHDLLNDFGSPDHFERLLLQYFARLGANAEIVPKNYGGKVGDCDIEAVFPALRLTISVQAKKHWGKTDDWSVRQIAEYADTKGDEDQNWIYASWVVSFASDFTDDAKKLAKEKGVILLNGSDFCKMIIANGLSM